MKKHSPTAAIEPIPAGKPESPASERKPLPAKKTNGVHANGGRTKGTREVRPANGTAHEGNLRDPDSREILRALMALKKGDFTTRLPIDWNGTSGKIADTFNDVAE